MCVTFSNSIDWSNLPDPSMPQTRSSACMDSEQLFSYREEKREDGNGGWILSAKLDNLTALISDLEHGKGKKLDGGQSPAAANNDQRSAGGSLANLRIGGNDCHVRPKTEFWPRTLAEPYLGLTGRIGYHERSSIFCSTIQRRKTR
ncbi:hypothetical protein OROGR_001885 [Orobanche gracilis]